MLNTVYTTKVINDWAWRLPYIIGGIAGLLFLFLRRNLQESSLFEHLATNQEIVKQPVLEVFKKIPWETIRTVLLVCMDASLFYTSFVYLPTYLSLYSHLSMGQALNLITVFVFISLFTVPFFAFISDRIGRRPMLIAVAIGVIVLAYFIFKGLSQPNTTSIILAVFGLTMLSSMEQGTTPATIVENYPLSVRYTGLAFGYNLGYTVFAGTAPMLNTWLIKITNSKLAPGYYLICCSIVTGLVVLLGIKETKARDLSF